MKDKVWCAKVVDPIQKKSFIYEVRVSIRTIALITLILVMASMIVTNYGLSVTNDVIAERVDTLNGKLSDLTKLLIAQDAATANAVKDIAGDVVGIRVNQGSQETKINIMWGILGTVFAGAVVSSLYIRKKTNGKVPAVGAE